MIPTSFWPIPLKFQENSSFPNFQKYLGRWVKSLEIFEFWKIRGFLEFWRIPREIGDFGKPEFFWNFSCGHLSVPFVLNCSHVSIDFPFSFLDLLISWIVVLIEGLLFYYLLTCCMFVVHSFIYIFLHIYCTIDWLFHLFIHESVASCFSYAIFSSIYVLFSLMCIFIVWCLFWFIPCLLIDHSFFICRSLCVNLSRFNR